MDSEEECSICGINLSDKFKTELNCNHIFHYECLMKTFMNQSNYKHKKQNTCPLCRKNCGYLPIVNGLKKIIVGIHVENFLECSNNDGFIK